MPCAHALLSYPEAMPKSTAQTGLGSIDKQALLEALRARVSRDLEALVRRQQDTARGATHEENRSEHAKDTRATEQSYLARGLAERVADLRVAQDRLARLDPVACEDEMRIGALVAIRDEDTHTLEHWWLVPVAGGIDLESAVELEGQRATHRIRTVTPAAPLGRSLVGLAVGDEGTFRSPKGERRFEVLEIA